MAFIPSFCFLSLGVSSYISTSENKLKRKQEIFCSKEFPLELLAQNKTKLLKIIQCACKQKESMWPSVDGFFPNGYFL